MRRTLLPAALVAALAVSGCQREEASAVAEAPQEQIIPPSEVGVVEARPEAIAVVSELPGRVAPTRIAEVRPRVGGIVVERVFEQGADVSEGQPLFRIDPATYEVAVASAKAGVAKAEAVLLQTRQEAERTRTLVSRNTVGKANLDTAVALEGQAAADVASARADLQSAEINLDYATVRAPIAGRIGRAIVTEGALVSAVDTSALATIQQLDPVYADIQQPVADLLRLKEALEKGTLTQLEPGVARVRLILDDGSQYPHAGRLLFSEAAVEASSGQVTLRAEFPNPDRDLLPGLYVRVAIDQGVDPDAIAVPNQAIQRDTGGRSLLYVVNGDDVLETREVRVVRTLGDRSVVDGLEPGARVVADGFQKVGPGAPVTAVSWEAAAQGIGANAPAPPSDAGATADPPASSPSEDASDSAGGSGKHL